MLFLFNILVLSMITYMTCFSITIILIDLMPCYISITVIKVCLLSDDEEELLEEAVQKSVDEANNDGHSSIAIPALGAGIVLNTTCNTCTFVHELLLHTSFPATCLY